MNVRLAELPESKHCLDETSICDKQKYDDDVSTEEAFGTLS